MTAAEIEVEFAFCLTSIKGDSAVTCTLSLMEANASDRSILRIWPSESRTSVTLLAVNPDSDAVISYVPGGSAGKR